MKKKDISAMVFKHLVHLAILEYAEIRGVDSKLVEQEVENGRLIPHQVENLDEVWVELDVSFSVITGL